MVANGRLYRSGRDIAFCVHKGRRIPGLLIGGCHRLKDPGYIMKYETKVKSGLYIYEI
jgi:hypothetical protein